jgi:hypothetical protein
MTELQSTDGSFFSRETDEEKSIESMFSMNASIGKYNGDDKLGDKKKQPVSEIGNSDEKNDNGKVARAGVKRRSLSTASDSTNHETVAKESTKNKSSKNLPRRKNLNDPTLMAIENYLKSGKCFSDTLEYEEVAAFASKIHRYTVERTRGRQGMLFRDGTIQNGDDDNVKITPIISTEEDVAQEYEYHQIYQREEYYAVATKFSKTVIEGARDTEEPSFALHTKTTNWLKRAAGMHRQYDPYEKDDTQQKPSQPAYSDDSDEGEMEAAWGGVGALGGSDRRLTRRSVKMTRKNRRLKRLEKETVNFRILAEVTRELAKQTKSGRTKMGKGKKRSVHAIGDATDDEDTERVGGILQEIGGQYASDEAFPSLESTGLATIYGPCFAGDDDAEMRILDEDDKEEKEPHKMQGSILPPVIARLGLEFYPKSIELEERSRTIPMKKHEHIGSGTSNERVTNRARAQKSSMLRNALSNKRARRWAMNEFFYSDLDREWYRSDGFVSDLAKHGLPIDALTQLTKQEWNLVRRKLRSRPRLFSKHFIAEQLKRRNRHRALVRRLQQDSMVREFSPILPGTPVTAFDNRSHTIRRGRILLHDPKKYSYLVQFDDKEAGCVICPDFEVAVSLKNQTPGAADVASSPPSLYEPHPDFSSSKKENEHVVELVLPKGVSNNGHTDDIERKLLINSVAVVTQAFERKKAILEALESCTDNPLESASNHCYVLLANLDRINTTLESAVPYLQVLYGRIYGSPVSNHEASKAKVEKKKLGTEIPNSKAFEELLTSLVSVSKKIGAFSTGGDGNDNNNNKSNNTIAKNSSSSSELLRKDLSGCTSLLLLANYLAETSSSLASSGIEKTTYSTAIDAALKISLDRFSNDCLPPITDNLLVGKMLEQESHVEGELKDLWTAVGMLRTEAALATDESRSFELRNASVS